MIDSYPRCRTHLASRKDSPEPRLVRPPAAGGVIAIPEMRGLHRHYRRRPGISTRKVAVDLRGGPLNFRAVCQHGEHVERLCLAAPQQDPVRTGLSGVR